MTTLTLRGVGRRFGDVTALTGIDLVAGSGTHTAVVGPSGSGKTTLLRLIAGFEVPDEGEILLDGQIVANPTASVPAHRRNVGLVMQDGALFPHLSVLDNIRFGMDRRDDAARALDLLDLVELDRKFAARQPHELSGGQQQRVALARALARRPRLMLLDEPFSALDAGLRDQMRQATAGILERAGVTTILVTHDQEEAMSFGSQLVVLRGGRVVQSGRPSDLYGSPVDPMTAEFLGEAIILDAVLSGGLAECGLGRVRVASRREGAATIMLRPEQVVLSAGTVNGHAVQARVLAAEFAGARTRIMLEASSGNGADRGVTFALRWPWAAPPVAPGSLVSVEVLGEAHVFAGREGAPG